MKKFLTLVVLSILFVVYVSLNYFAPTIESSLVLEQLNNPSAVSSRSIGATSYVFPIFSVVSVLVIVRLWKKEISNVFKSD